MAVIPKVLDYGAQPSLRTSRIDLPGQGDLAIAEAVAVAADTFSAIQIESKQKTDAFNYSMRVKEAQSADLAHREKLKDDREYEKFDEKYTSGMKLDAERIAEKYPLSAHDSALFGAEYDLIHARGRASVQEFRRVIEIDDNLAKLDGAIETVKEEVHIAAPGESNALLTNALDLINAAEENLWLDKEDARLKREDLVQTVAFKKLANMDPKERQKILEGSLAYRKALGPITVDDIRAGRGTGYIADFLHTDAAKAMLEETKKENEIDTAQAEGYAFNDATWAENPGLTPTAQRARLNAFKDSDLSAEARKAGEAANARRTLMEDNIRQEGLREIDNELRRIADEFGLSWEQLSGGMRSKLESQAPGLAKATRDYVNSKTRQEDFPSVTASEAIEAYAGLTLQEQAEWNADEWMVPIPMREPKRWGDHVTREQADLWTTAGGQITRSIEAGRVPEKGLTLTQQLENVFTLVMPKPTASSSSEDRKKWSRMMLAYHNAAIQLGGRDSLSEEQQMKLAMDITQFEVYERRFGYDKEGTNWATMSQDQIERSYLKLDEPAPPFNQTAYDMQIDHEAIPELGLPAFKGKAIDWLKNTGSTVNPIEQGLEPTQEVLEEAWFYLVTEGPGPALNRLRGLPGF